jgi:hypothetical protein
VEGGLDVGLVLEVRVPVAEDHTLVVVVEAEFVAQVVRAAFVEEFVVEDGLQIVSDFKYLIDILLSVV